MKKALAVFLCIFLILSSITAQGLREALQNESSEGAWSIGDKVEGFTVTDIRPFDYVGATAVTFEHDRTGAIAVWIDSDSTNRAFSIAFRTHAPDDKGIPHVFEHATLSGSDKYPSETLFFSLASQTYNTFMNAMTATDTTFYLFASLSEAQLLKYADFYLDSCFNPLIMSDKAAFERESWRYAMDDAESALRYEGTVYNEMGGSYSLDNASYYNFLKAILPGSFESKVSGGKPSDIPEMTHEELKAFHDTWYVPSNSMTTIYGSIEDISAFLSLLDSYFEPYGKSDMTELLKDSGYTPITGSVELSIPYGVEASSSTERGCNAFYGFVAKDSGYDELWQIDALTTILNNDNSILKEKLREALPYVTFSCAEDFSASETIILVEAVGIEREDIPLFKATVDEAFGEIAANGFDLEAVEAIVAAYKKDTLLGTEKSDLCVDIVEYSSMYWGALDNPYALMDYYDATGSIFQWAEDGTLQALVGKYLVSNPLTALVSTYKEPGLKEEEEAALAEKLAAIRATLTEEEKAAIIEKTNAPASSDDNSAYVSALNAVSVDTLPEEYREYTFSDTLLDSGVRRVDVDASVSGIGQVNILLNASGLSKDELFWVKLYTELLGDLDTEEHTRSQLTTLTDRYLYSPTLKLSLMEEDNESGFTPYIRVSFISLDEDLEKAYDTVYELLFSSKVGDIETVRDLVSKRRTSLERSINNNAYQVLLYRANAANKGSSAAFYEYNYIPYYAFLTEVEEYCELYPEGVKATLEAVQSYFMNAYGAISGYCGGEEGQNADKAAAEAFFQKLDNYEVPSQTYVYDTPASSEVYILDTSVNFNLLAIGTEKLGLGKYDSEASVITSLVYDSYLIPVLRHQNGAYDCVSGYTGDTLVFISYRDPNVLSTFQSFAGIPAFLDSLEVTQEELDGYIMSTYSGLATPTGELTGAQSFFLNYLSGEPGDATLQAMRSVKSVTPETVKKYVSIFTEMVENGIISTACSESTYNANAELYESVFMPFGEIKGLEDLTGDEWYFQAVSFVKENGLMTASSETLFGADDEGTLGELAAAFFMLIGGNDDQAAAIAMLSGYGIVPASDPATVLTNSDLAACCVNFIAAMDVPASMDAEFIAGNGLVRSTDEAFLASASTRADVAQAIMASYMYIVSQ